MLGEGGAHPKAIRQILALPGAQTQDVVYITIQQHTQPFCMETQRAFPAGADTQAISFSRGKMLALESCMGSFQPQIAKSKPCLGILVFLQPWPPTSAFLVKEKTGGVLPCSIKSVCWFILWWAGLVLRYLFLHLANIKTSVEQNFQKKNKEKHSAVIYIAMAEFKENGEILFFNISTQKNWRLQ